MSSSNVLVIDDDADIRRLLSVFLTRRGYSVHEAGDAKSGLQAVASSEPDIILVDLNLPDGSGFDVVRTVRQDQQPACVIVISGHGSIPSAVQALKEGADNFVTKPLDLDILLAYMRKSEEALVLRRQLLAQSGGESAAAIVKQSHSPEMKKVLDVLPAVADSDGSILITGESGTGKSLVARAIHELSPRRDQPFVELNCSSLSRELLESELFGHAAGAFTGATRAKPGLIEVADTGTFFLDEIGDMDLSVQPKLLKVIEDGQIRRLGSVQSHAVDVRILAATHFDLEQQITKGCFRHDLFFRLNVLHVRLPPLRDRPEDIPHLATSFLAQRGREVRGLSPEAIDWLRSYSWPGNVRELRNLVERAAVYARGGLIQPKHFGVPLRERLPEQLAGEGELPASPPVTESPPAVDLSLGEVERRHVERVLESVGGNRTRASKILGITRQTLIRKLRGYGLDRGRAAAEADASDE